MKKLAIVISCILFLMPSLFAETYYFSYKDKDNIEVQKIGKSKIGFIKAYLDESQSVQWNIKKIKHVSVEPAPSFMLKFIRVYRKNNYDKIIKLAPKFLEKYQYLGFGRPVAYYYGKSLIAKGKIDEAMKMLKKAASFAYIGRKEYGTADKASVLATLAETYIIKGDFSKARETLSRIDIKLDKFSASYYYYVNGKLIEKETKDKNKALLNYFKTIFLYSLSDRSLGEISKKQLFLIKKETIGRVIAIYQKNGDKRAEYFQKLLVKKQ